ncbi:MAG: prolyl oligopeptidase family serine peptidase [Gemmatimonadetes bacterium]|nr:prolyl oligopeptidase family serine peptidase [Gemmatimonadota bacterium]
MRRPTLLRLALFVLLSAASVPGVGAQQAAFDLSVKNIMRGPELTGREPSQVRFTADGQWIYFRWLQPGAAWNESLKPFRVAARAGAAPELVTDAHMDSVAPMLANGRRSRDGTRTIVAANGDLWLRTQARGGITVRRITQTNASESDPRFSLDEREILFVRENNAYAFDLASGLTRQLTDIRSGAAPKDPEPPKGQRAALAEQQKDLLQYIRDQLAADSAQKAEREAAEGRRLPVVWVPQAERIGGLSLSPDGKSALLSTFTPATGTKGSDVPDYVNADGYTRMIPGRTKVGDAQGTQKVGHLDIATGKVTWLELTPDKKPAGGANVGDWSDDGRFALLFVTSADFKNRYLWSVASSGGTMAMVDALRDEAWVNGPCFGCTGWTPDGRAWFVSEATGYSHLYSALPDGSGRAALTSGSWEVLSVDRADDGRSFNLVTSEPSPFTRQGYRMAMTGGPRTRITTGDGGHSPTIAPDGATIATVYSTANTPPELFLTRAGSGTMSQLTTSTTAEFRSYAWKVPPIVMVPGEDGTPVPARIYRPEAHGAQPNGAGVIFVHGAGYLHNVHNWWSSYSREYMFHHLLAARGYTVLDIDYRGSAGYGRDWRTAIYRWMGGKDLDDHVSGSKYLTAQHGIAPERIGIYGGSYGGFITLMALFNKAEYFGAGAALRSVTDWASYNHGYTGRILNLPQDDRESFRKSSPIFFAEGLKDPLLIAHGMVDTNVQFQDVVQLAQRLIELEKVDWEMAVYPVENHGFERPSSWHDEYRRILELFDRTIGPNGSKVRR